MKNFRNETILIITLAIIFGFVSGILGYMFLFFNGNNLPFMSRVNIGDANWDSQIVIDQPKNVIIEQDLQLQQVNNDVLPTLVNIYHWKKITNPLNQIYSPSEALSQGVVITSDGWIISTRSEIPSLIGDYEAVGYQSKKYIINKFIEDDATGLIFGKMEAGNLPISKIGNSNDLSVGQTLVVVSKNGGLILSNITKIGYQFDSTQDNLISSDELSKQIFIDTDLNTDYNGAIITNLKGEMVGIVNDGVIIPVNYFKNIIGQILNGQEVSRASLGINYIDLSSVDGLIDFGDKGALVYGNPLKTSAAFGKLLDGDLIKKVNDIELNNKYSLSDIINNYKSGDKLDLLINRDNEEVVLEIVLK